MPEIAPLPATTGGRKINDGRTARLRGILAAGLLFIVAAWVYARVIHKPKTGAVGPSSSPKVAARTLTPPSANPAAGLALPGSQFDGQPNQLFNPSPGGGLGSSGPSVGQPQTGGSPDAIPKLQRRLLLNPKDVKARVELAVLLDRQGNSNDAEDLLRSALQMGQRSPDIYYALGTLYANHNQTAGAVEEFRIVVQLAPKNFAAQLKLGQAYLYMGRSKEAEAALKKARDIDPSVPDTYLGLAFLYDAPERYPDALRYLNEYITRSKQPGPAYALLCRVCLNMRQYDKSTDAGQKAVAAMPDNASAWYNLGQAYSYRPGDQYVAEAQRAFEKALSITPEWGQAHFELARLLQRQNRLPEGIAHYREAVRLAPSVGKYHYQLGQLLNRTGQADEAKKELAEAQRLIPLNQKTTQLINKLSANPRAIEPLFELGTVYRKLGDFKQARAVFQSILEDAPGDARAKAQLQEIARLAAANPTP